jgi:hypothetical protein
MLIRTIAPLAVIAAAAGYPPGPERPLPELPQERKRI